MARSAAILARNAAFGTLTVLLDPWLADDGAIAALRERGAIDWHAVMATARRHRVIPLLSARAQVLAKHDPAVAALPDDVSESLREEGKAALLGEMVMLGELRRLKAAFAAIGVPFLVFKGLTLSQRCFGRLGLRVNRDIDLLIDRADMTKSDAMLRDAGYLRVDPAADASAADLERNLRRNKDWVYANQAKGIVLEVHHRLFDNVTLCDSGVLARAEPIRLFGQLEVPAMALADELPYLALHGAMHAWSRLKWLTDFAYRLQAQDADTLPSILARAGRGPAGCALHQAISVCWQVFRPPSGEPRASRPWRTGLLRAAAIRAMAGQGSRELEDTRFGTTLKNASHYLLSTQPSYIRAEFDFDLGDTSAEADGTRKNIPIWLYRPIAWAARRI